ncbi:urea carboxylase [Rhodococcus sp. B50]|uniref:urea carboxylase n=1 Tax=Rhodococcus sp. B50 TaxID=2682847 RepID=UPI001BD230E2|nr:urea carboxylase [Rhodococcus sp. B50]MBS9375663.1 Acetyl-/propionyl-coenzyme A carboxylase alpha chain [Rhodococcus sp. B50]
MSTKTYTEVPVPPTFAFDSLLVANRGEIACRIMRSAHKLGLKTVAVYSDADAAAAHVELADIAVRLGPAPAAESYLRADLVIEAALATGAGAIHPGYGFLSENAEFAAACEAAGIAFVGPTPGQLRVFGDKHTAREAARAVGAPLVPGSGLLDTLEDALTAAETIGYPVMLKAVGGGGGIGMQACRSADDLREAYERVIRLAAANFSSSGVFLERFVPRARHVEVQVFGDGHGRTISLGTRDCSLQRRNQKVVEEAPAPNLPDRIVEQMLSCSRALASSVQYRSAGTVEFVYDVDRNEVSFLEMNTRLQVEHPVTEEVTGVDLVEWMLRLARGDESMLDGLPDSGPEITGHAVEARVYAEDPGRDHRPSAGLLTHVEFPAHTRIETWVNTGTEVGSFYDPMLAKVIVRGESRRTAFSGLSEALGETRIHGVQTNLPQLRRICSEEAVLDARHVTTTLAEIPPVGCRIDVLRAGTMTTVQDFPGRIGLWKVGIPPSGPMDDLSFRAANVAVGNPEGTPGLECTLLGPRLEFSDPTTVCITGARAEVTVDGAPVPMWEPVEVPAGSILEVGTPIDAGLRTYIAVRGGLDVPLYHGSASTFTLGGFGGPTGRAVATGDVLGLASGEPVADPAPVPADVRPEFGHIWHLAVTEGPQPAPAYFTAEDLQQFYDATWTVQTHANRTGIRLDGPKPTWSRSDGGDAGLHPSNLHDNPYSVGALNVSGDTPILLGPDGPSLGGFACPLTVVAGHRWKLGQIRPGDSLRFVPVTDEGAVELRTSAVRGADLPPVARQTAPDGGRLGRIEPFLDHPEVVYLRGGDDNILVEYGEMVLDLGLRMRVHALSEALAATTLPGIIDVTPGVRSLHIHFDPDVLPQSRLLGVLQDLETELPATRDLVVPSRTVRLPLSFDDPSIAEAISRYRSGVRDEAPWLPSNTEFIRRINGLDSVEQVRDTVFDAEYLVLGLGDVYLGAPLAVPLDPRHRLVTTKYNPARTWTPSDAVGIGGKYLCVYGMESPGGYQLVGRTIPIWSGYRQTGPFEEDKPWLFRFFDRIVWEPVTPEQLLEYRAAAKAGRFDADISDGTFALADHLRFLEDNADSIDAFHAVQSRAFEVEKQAWRDAGEFDRVDSEPIEVSAVGDPLDAMPPGAVVVEAPMVGNVWRVEVAEGDTVATGDTTVILEAMKLEMPVSSETTGTVLKVLVSPGTKVAPGTPLLVIGAV